MNNQQNTKIQAIAFITQQMHLYSISLAEIAHAMEGEGKPVDPLGKRDVMMRMFSRLGGIFIFSGIAAYIGMFWQDMNSAMHVIVTLGAGLALQALGLLLLSNDQYRRMATPLLLVALILQPTGWFVAIDEWFPHGSEPRYAVLFVMTVMAIQQAAIFSRYRLTLLLGAVMFFAYGAAFTLFDLMEANEKLVLIVMGASMMTVAQGLRTTAYSALCSFACFAGSIMFYSGAFELLQHTPVELLYLGLTCGLMYFSTCVRSGTLLMVSTLAMLAYIGYFTEEHFVHSIGWPLVLIAMGIIFFAVGGVALRIKKQYIS